MLTNVGFMLQTTVEFCPFETRTVLPKMPQTSFIHFFASNLAVTSFCRMLSENTVKKFPATTLGLYRKSVVVLNGDKIVIATRNQRLQFKTEYVLLERNTSP